MDPLPPIVHRTSEPPPVDAAARIVPTGKDSRQDGGGRNSRRRRPRPPGRDDDAVTLSLGAEAEIHVPAGPGDVDDEPGDGHDHVDVIA